MQNNSLPPPPCPTIPYVQRQPQDSARSFGPVRSAGPKIFPPKINQKSAKMSCSALFRAGVCRTCSKFCPKAPKGRIVFPGCPPTFSFTRPKPNKEDAFFFTTLCPTTLPPAGGQSLPVVGRSWGGQNVLCWGFLTNRQIMIILSPSLGLWLAKKMYPPCGMGVQMSFKFRLLPLDVVLTFFERDHSFRESLRLG